MNRRLPKRYSDIIPQPLPSLPRMRGAHLVPITPPSSIPAPNPSPSSQPSVNARETIRAPQNSFGLVREYVSKVLPCHDPEAFVDIQNLFDEPNSSAIPSSQSLRSETSFFPYPNESSFLLDDWYWNHGSQKSRGNFNKLLHIIGHPDFRPEDVRRTNWSKIDAKLAGNPFDGTGSATEEHEGWITEDAGWHRTPISISVPFHSRTKAPGPKEYYVGDLYHRPLVDVIREKLTNPSDVRHFHYEPYELLWNPTSTSKGVRVHGELYTSPAFLDADRELQASPAEPGCNLPRVVVALMFWSDVTHLTSFGTAKLWPCYLYFGNESKYRRCKPSYNLCNHVAYFQKVSFISFA